MFCNIDFAKSSSLVIVAEMSKDFFKFVPKFDL